MADRKKNQGAVQTEENLTDGTVFSADYEGEAGRSRIEERQKKRRQASKKKKKKVNKPLIGVIAAVVIVGILVGVYFLVNSMQGAQEEELGSTYPTHENGEQYAVDAMGNEIDSYKDVNGNIVSAGVIELMSYSPFEMKDMHIENEYGTFEVSVYVPIEKTTNAAGEEVESTDHIEYTIKGYEDVDFSGGVGTVASMLANLSSTQIIDVMGKNPQDYGLTEPRATVEANYNTGEAVILLIGNEAPGGVGTYVKATEQENGVIYLVDTSAVESVFFNPVEYVNTSITDSASDDDTLRPVEFTIRGKNFPEPVVIVQNNDETSLSTYKMTEPSEKFVNMEKGTGMVGSVRSLTAESVAAVHPSEDQLKKYGLDKPQTTIEAKYTDISYTLSASTPNEENQVYVYAKEKDTIYVVLADRVLWASANYEDFVYEYIMRPSKEYVESIDVKTGDKAYTFTLKEEKVTDDGDNEFTQIVASYGKTKLEQGYFDAFYENLVSAKYTGEYDGKESADKAFLTITFNYNNDKKSDTVVYTEGESRKYEAKVNDSENGFVYDTYITQLVKDTKAMSENKKVDIII